jgi:hypothetical protein
LTNGIEERSLHVVLTKLLCFATGHRWNKIAYPDADTADGFFLRCRRCHKENHDSSSGVNGAMGWGFIH